MPKTSRKRVPAHPHVDTLYAWIATRDGREHVVAVDVRLPGGDARTLTLVTARRTEAERFAIHARRYMEEQKKSADPIAQIELRIFRFNNGHARPAAPLRVLRESRRPDLT
jgi:hypothetical protein